MSPTESELRTALRAGEGESLAADEIIAHARTARHDRRRTIAAVSGAVAAVLAIGGVVTAIQVNHDDRTGSPARTPAGQGPLTCPTAPPTVNAPSSSSGQLFPSDVTSIRACLYQVQRLTASTTIDGPAARSYARRFNALPTKSSQACPLILTQKTIVLLPATENGPAATVVGKIGGCGTTTNGKTKRDAGQLLTEIETGLSASSAPRLPSGGGKNTPGPGPS
jgi:hypothetical protein